MKKHLFKRIISLSVCSTILISALVACGNQTTNSTPSTSAENTSASGTDSAAADNTNLPSYKFQIGINTVEDSVRGEMCHAFKNYVEDASNGRITVDIFSEGTLGSEAEMTEMVKTGNLDFTIPGISAMSNIDSNFGAISLPFLVNDYDTAHSVLDGDLGDAFKEIGASKGYKILGWGDLGMAQITNNVRPINTLADLKGINLRCTNEEVSLATMKALGCVTTTLAFSELYLGLSQGVVDGQFNPIDAIYQNSFTEVQDYLAELNLFYYGIALVMNNDKFNSYDSETQKILLEGAEKAQEASREYASKSDAEYLKKAEDENCFKEITYPDTTEFKAAVASVYDNYLPNCDQRVQDAIAKIREAK